MLGCAPSHTWGPRSPTAPALLGSVMGSLWAGIPRIPAMPGQGWMLVEASAGVGEPVWGIAWPRFPVWAPSLPLAGLLLAAHRAERSQAAAHSPRSCGARSYSTPCPPPHPPPAAVGDLVLSVLGGGPAGQAEGGRGSSSGHLARGRTPQCGTPAHLLCPRPFAPSLA